MSTSVYRITDLSLDTFSNAGTIEFPALTSLSVSLPSLSIVQDLLAPNLRRLSLGRPLGRPFLRDPHLIEIFENHMKPIVDFMRDASKTPTTSPTTFVLHQAFAAKSICVVLERWVQLQHISVLDEWAYRRKPELQYLERMLKTRDTLGEETGPNAQATWKICPRLQTLHFEVEDTTDLDLHYPGEDPQEDYRRMARAVAHSRRYSPLERISWGARGPGGKCITNS